MGSNVTVVGLGGSLRPNSSSLAAMRVALRSAAEQGAEVTELDVRDLDLPMYVPRSDAPQAAVDMAQVVARADGMLGSAPLYHGSVSGSFKNAIDWLQLLANSDPPYLKDKVVGLIAAAGGVQGLKGGEHDGVHRSIAESVRRSPRRASAANGQTVRRLGTDG